MGGVGSRRVTLNECYGLSLSQFANGQPNGEQCHSQAADHAVDNRLRLGMIDNIAVANRAAPIGIQQIHQQARVFQAGPGAQTGSEQGEHKAFGQKEIAHGFPGKPNGEQGADLRGALFHAEDKEEPHENERSEHEKKAQANEQAAEVIGGITGDRFDADIAEVQPDLCRIEFLAKRRLDLSAVGRIKPKPHGSRFAVAIGPQLLAGFQSDKGLGRAAVLFPVILILISHSTGIEINPGIPIT